MSIAAQVRRQMRASAEHVSKAFGAHGMAGHLSLVSAAEAERRYANAGVFFGQANSDFGQLLIAWDEHGIFRIGFIDAQAPLSNARWPAHWQRDDGQAADIVQKLISGAAGMAALSAWAVGNAFQDKVWHALMAVGPGHLISYGDLARLAGFPGAARAVGTAMANNRLALFVPCHRVVRANGELGEYHWGRARKQQLIAAELFSAAE